MSSRIQVKPKELIELADLIKAEREDIITDPKNRLLMTMSTLSGVKYSERAYQSLNECIQAVDHYLAKLEESMIITKNAADDFRTEDEKEKDQIKHLLYEFIGFNDLRRLGEYDPITHEKLTGKDRSIAMLSLTGGRFLKVLKIPGVKKFFNTLSTEFIAEKIASAWRLMKHLPQSIHKWVPKGDGVGIGSKLQFADEVSMTTPNVYKAEKSGTVGIRTQGVGNGKKVTKPRDVPRIKEIEVNFKRNPKHDATEFEKQLKAQEEGINSLTVDEFIKNRDRYLKDGRALEGDAAQKLARQEALKEKVSELRKQGLSREEAKKQADEWLKDQAALHNPDQIAGGKPDHIGGIGDKKINSSIGSQWKSRIKELDKDIRASSEKMTQEERKSTFLNIKLKH